MAQDEYRPSNIFHRVSTVLDRLEGVPERSVESDYAAASKKNWTTAVDMLPDSNVPSSAVEPPPPERSPSRRVRSLQRPAAAAPTTSVYGDNVFQKVSNFLEYVEGVRPPIVNANIKKDAAWSGCADVQRGYSAAVSVAMAAKPSTGSSEAPPSIAVPPTSGSALASTVPRTRGLKQPSQANMQQPQEQPHEQPQEQQQHPSSSSSAGKSQVTSCAPKVMVNISSFPPATFSRPLVQRQYVVSPAMRIASPSPPGSYVIRQQSPRGASRSPVIRVTRQTPTPTPAAAPTQFSPPPSQAGGRSAADSYYSAGKTGSSAPSMSAATTATTPSDAAAGRGRRLHSDASPELMVSRSGTASAPLASAAKPTGGGSRASSEAGLSHSGSVWRETAGGTHSAPLAGRSPSLVESARGAGSQAGSLKTTCSDVEAQSVSGGAARLAVNAEVGDAPLPDWLPLPEESRPSLWVDKRVLSPEVALQRTQWSHSEREINFVQRRAEREQISCPKGHCLSPYTTKGGYCDGCTRQIEAGIGVMACTSCNWWLCSNCHRSRVASLFPAPATLASVNGQGRGRWSTPTRRRGRARSQSQSPESRRRAQSPDGFAECGCDGTSGRGDEPDSLDGGLKNHRSCCEPPAFEVQEVEPWVYKQRIDEQHLYEERLYEERLHEQQLCEQRYAAAVAREARGDTLSKKEEYRVCGGPDGDCAVQ